MSTQQENSVPETREEYIDQLSKEGISDAEWDCDPNTTSDELNHRCD